jgi:hypothetical protein
MRSDMLRADIQGIYDKSELDESKTWIYIVCRTSQSTVFGCDGQWSFIYGHFHKVTQFDCFAVSAQAI